MTGIGENSRQLRKEKEILDRRIPKKKKKKWDEGRRGVPDTIYYPKSKQIDGCGDWRKMWFRVIFFFYLFSCSMYLFDLCINDGNTRLVRYMLSVFITLYCSI